MIRSASESKFGLSYRVFVWHAAILGALAASALGVAVAQEPKREFAQVLTLATTAVAEPMLRSLAARYAEAARVELRVTVHTAAEVRRSRARRQGRSPYPRRRKDGRGLGREQ